MWNPIRLLRLAPLWGLTLFALAFWGTFNQLQQQAWVGTSRRAEARPDGRFEDLAPEAAPLPAIYLDNDSLYWLRLAEQLLTNGAWRPRHLEWDNVPFGRPNHWSSPLVWMMAGGARLAARFSDRPATELLPVVAPWIGPALFALLLCATAVLLGRRLAPWPAGWLVLSLATLPPILRSFSVLHIDHHGLVDIPALGMSLLLLIGLVGRRAPSPVDAYAQQRAARGWFLASGVLGGLGLWFQASHQLILIAGTLVALTLWALFFRPPLLLPKNKTEDDLLDPVLWRTWAVAGALVSLAAYALEYAPAHLGMQLDVNHPLYALSWWGGTEAILAGARARRQRRWTRAHLAVIAAGVLPAVATFLLLRYGPAEWFRVSSPFLQRIHEQIKEFQPLLGTLHGVQPLLLFLLFNSLPLIALIGAGLWAARKLPARERMGLQLVLFTLVPAFALCLRHARYSSLLAATLWGMAVAVFLAQPRWPLGRWPRILPLGLLAAGCVSNLLLTLSPLANPRQPFMPVDRWIPQMIQRDVARELATLPGFPKSRVLCGYNVAPALQAFADARTTGGLYWENEAGLRAAADFFAATNDEDALRVLRDRDVRWVVAETRPGTAQTWLYYRYGANPRVDLRSTLAHRLASATAVPNWLERVPPEQIPLASQALFQVYRVR
jgi:hypothetical protein